MLNFLGVCLLIASLTETEANREVQILQSGIWVERLGWRGFTLGLLRYRLKLSCWGRRWRFIPTLLDILKIRVVLSKSHLISLTTGLEAWLCLSIEKEAHYAHNMRF